MSPNTPLKREIVPSGHALVTSNSDERDCLCLARLESHGGASCNVKSLAEGQEPVEGKLLVRL